MARKNMEHYSRWKSIKCRCYNPHHDYYKNYGGRGITVCDEWKNDFLCFYKWACNSGYKKGLTLDRIDNNKGYSPENCKWSTRKEQNRNQRTNRKITINGVTKLLCEWADESGLSMKEIHKRIKRGWSEDDLLKPTKSNRKLVTFDGLTLSITDWAKKAKIPYTTFQGRLKKGRNPFENLRKSRKGG